MAAEAGHGDGDYGVATIQPMATAILSDLHLAALGEFDVAIGWMVATP